MRRERDDRRVQVEEYRCGSHAFESYFVREGRGNELRSFACRKFYRDFRGSARGNASRYGIRETGAAQDEIDGFACGYGYRRRGLSYVRSARERYRSVARER